VVGIKGAGLPILLLLLKSVKAPAKAFACTSVGNDVPPTPAKAAVKIDFLVVIALHFFQLQTRGLKWPH